MFVAYKYRIYPNKEQKIYFSKCFGCVRFFYNRSLNDMKEVFDKEHKFENITPARYKNDFAFLKEVDSLALANAQMNRNTAFKSFFKGHNKFPKYKSKKNEQSYSTNNQKGSVRFSSDGKYLTIPKCKNIKVRKHRNFVGTMPDGRYYVSMLANVVDKPQPKETNKMIGIDLGLKSFLVTSEGNKTNNPKHFIKSQDKLAREQRKLSKMAAESHDREKQKKKVASIQLKIANQRKEFCHVLSTQISNEYAAVAVEDLNLCGMAGALQFGKRVATDSECFAECWSTNSLQKEASLL